MGQRTRDERKRLERYLEWRRDRGDGARIDRRWRMRRAGVAFAFMLVTVGVLAWPTQNRAIRHSALPASAPKAAEVVAPPAEPPSAPTDTALVPLPARVVPVPEVAAREAASVRESTLDSIARARRSRTDAVATAPTPQYQSPAPVTTRESEAPSRIAQQEQDVVARETVPPEATSSEHAGTSVWTTAILPPAPPVPPSGSQGSRAHVVPEVEPPSPPRRLAKRSCADLTEAGHDSSADGLARTRRIADCVGGWLEGEVQEFRDGFNRELEEFRAGLDKVGRGLEWLGGKLRR